MLSPTAMGLSFAIAGTYCDDSNSNSLAPKCGRTAQSHTVLPVTDGMRFILDGVTYEFDTSAVPSVTPGAVRVPIVAGPTVRQFVDAIAAAMPAGITVSYEAGRMNFGGATTGTFTQLQTAGVLTSLGNPGTPGAAGSGTCFRYGPSGRPADRGCHQQLGLPRFGSCGQSCRNRSRAIGGWCHARKLGTTGPGDGVAPGGIITGNAFINGQMYAVSDKGGLYVVNNPLGFGGGNVGDYLEGSYDLKGIQFSGLVEGPVPRRMAIWHRFCLASTRKGPFTPSTRAENSCRYSKTAPPASPIHYWLALQA